MVKQLLQGVLLSKQISTITAKLNHLISDKNVVVNNKVPENILLEVNQDLLDIVVSNLLRNAIQYTQKGSVTVEYIGEKVIITDTGLGIPQQEIDNINQAFFTLQPNGVGLGLSIVQRIIKKLDWHLDVHSKERFGTKVALQLRPKTRAC